MTTTINAAIPNHNPTKDLKKILRSRDFLKSEVRKWDITYKHKKETEFVKRTRKALREFGSFIDSYIQIWQSYLSEDENPNFLSLPNYPTEWLGKTVDQALDEYWRPLRLGVEQYTINRYKSINQKQGYSQYLDKALLKINEYKANHTLSKGLNIIPYFEKVNLAVRFPFAPILLIGLSYKSIYDHNWNAIPHEIGHHVFWNSEFHISNTIQCPIMEGPQVLKSLIENLDWAAINAEKEEEQAVKGLLKIWAEEIFAEVFASTLVDFYFASAYKKAMKLIKQEKDLFINAPEHPTPYLLPFICGYAIGKEDQEMEDIWKEQLEAEGLNLARLEIDNKQPKDGEVVHFEVVKSALRKFVERIVELIDNSNQNKENGKDFIKPLPKDHEHFKEFIAKSEKQAQHPREAFLTAQYSAKRVKNNMIEDSLLIPRILTKNQWNCPNCGQSNDDINTICVHCQTSKNATVINILVNNITETFNFWVTH